MEDTGMQHRDRYLLRRFIDWQIENNVQQVRHGLYSYKAFKSVFTKYQIVNQFLKDYFKLK
jgi:hypothetical protein